MLAFVLTVSFPLRLMLSFALTLMLPMTLSKELPSRKMDFGWCKLGKVEAV